MKLKELCKKRKIPRMERFANETPLLVPSFSSNVALFENPMELQELYDTMIESTPETSLISAFDLYYKKLRFDSISYSDLTFIDSGKYEFSNQRDFLNQEKLEWKIEWYHETLNKLEPLSSIVIINFDDYTSFKEQIRIAKNTFSRFPDYISDFLIKPERIPENINEPIWDFGVLKEYLEDFDYFDIIGLTEKDLGFSLYERCQNLIKIRKLIGLDKPIHIFGCIDLQTVFLYCILGADIFDGTSWLRFYYWRGHTIYLKNYSLIEELWSKGVKRNYFSAFLKNLDNIRRIGQKIRQFINTHNFDLLDFDNIVIEKIKKILHEFGVDF